LVGALALRFFTNDTEHFGFWGCQAYIVADTEQHRSGRAPFLDHKRALLFFHPAQQLTEAGASRKRRYDDRSVLRWLHREVFSSIIRTVQLNRNRLMPIPASASTPLRSFAPLFQANRCPVVPRNLPHGPPEHLRLGRALNITVQGRASYLCFPQQGIEAFAQSVITRDFALLRDPI